MTQYVNRAVDGPPLIPWQDAGKAIAGDAGPKRTKIAALIATGELRSVLIGRRRFVPADAIAEFVARLQAGDRVA